MTSEHTAGGGRNAEREESTHYVLADDHLGAAVARRLRADGRVVYVIDGSDGSGASVRGNPADVGTLEAAGLGPESTVIVATRSDGRNLLIAQLVRTRFGVADVVVLANTPERIETFADAGHEPVCATTVTSEALAGSV
jgi:trk system potassium uptake protein TrkA